MNEVTHLGQLARNVHDTAEWVAYWPADAHQWNEYGMGLPGNRVRSRHDLPGIGVREGQEGTVVALGRSVRANHDFAVRRAQAATEGRELNASDYEILIDSEGPVVLWDGENVPRWHPGQSDPTELVVSEECPC